ncbi:MAG TPA: 30S ribosomal protein S8 [Candidatus Dojkabacteria bacterium]|nr:30S ribosomal protein S8 [Candidatus Dojkabacteria bacterium]HRO64618.1 30S ribosomal protein S8 [Candidatus Dojkabacteria bacterium]HRP36450.1 30S ribosomal protein S8 [Candidatus Dojkabacteria bacterium]HRP51421.1 30S ribosomal protein S8 [Candidatus Dojkabacteria bacterium]
MVNDTIADYLTRVRNAQLRKQEFVTIPSTKMLVAISEILKKSNMIEDYEVSNEENLPQQTLNVKLKYFGSEPAMRSMKRISKPGLRKYVNYKEIPKVLSGKGIAIISTPQGVLSGDDAKKSKVGGEYLCEIW